MQKNFSECIKRVSQMFPNLKQFQKALRLVITKTEMLEDNPNENMEHWINFFKENPDRICVFPMVSRSRVGKQYDFDDHTRLVRFLQTNQIINPVHKIVLSNEASLYVKNVRINANNTIKRNIRNIFSLVAEDYQTVTDSSDFSHSNI